MKIINFTFLIPLLLISCKTEKWEKVYAAKNELIRCIKADGETIYFGSDSTLTEIKNGKAKSCIRNIDVNSICLTKENVFAATYQGVFRLNRTNSKSKRLNCGSSSIIAFSILEFNKSIYVGTNEGLFLSKNKGDSWHIIEKGLFQKNILSLKEINGVLYAGNSNGQLYKWIHKENRWFEFPSSLGTDVYIEDFLINETNMYIATFQHGLFRSTDKGTSWTNINNGLLNVNTNCLVTFDKQILVGTNFNEGVSHSINNGVFWKEFNDGMPFHISVYCLLLSNSKLYAGSSEGLWIRD